MLLGLRNKLYSLNKLFSLKLNNFLKIHLRNLANFP